MPENYIKTKTKMILKNKIPLIRSEGDSNIDVSQSYFLSCAPVHMILWYDAVFTLSPMSEAGTIKLRQSQVMDILRHSGSDTQTLRWIDAPAEGPCLSWSAVNLGLLLTHLPSPLVANSKKARDSTISTFALGSLLSRMRIDDSTPGRSPMKPIFGKAQADA